MAVITMTELTTSSTPVFRVELREAADSKPMLTRRFRERHAAYGMALAVGFALDINPTLEIPTVRVQDGEDGDEC